MYNSLRSRFKLCLNTWFIITQKLLPRQWRSEKALKLLDLAEKGMEKINYVLDVD